jgi:hypothetical protein
MIQVIHLRGTQEPPAENGVSSTFLDALDPARFQPILVPYPAEYGNPTSFFESNVIGRQNAMDLIRRAPDRVVLSGYSAGAYIAGDIAVDIVAGREDGVEMEKIAAVALLADPKRPAGAGCRGIPTPGGSGIAGERDIFGVRALWGTASTDPIAALDDSNLLRTVADLTVFASIDPRRWDAWARSVLTVIEQRRLQPAWKFWLQPRKWADAAAALDRYLRLGGHTFRYLDEGICTKLAEVINSQVTE